MVINASSNQYTIYSFITEEKLLSILFRPIILKLVWNETHATGSEQYKLKRNKVSPKKTKKN